jgi:hypothetical protein
MICGLRCFSIVARSQQKGAALPRAVRSKFSSKTSLILKFREERMAFTVKKQLQLKYKISCCF